MPSKGFWKEFTIVLLVLWAIYFVIQLTAPFLAWNMWDGVRNLLGLGIVLSRPLSCQTSPILTFA